LFSWKFRASKTKNRRFDVDETKQDSVNGSVGHSRNCAFCYRLPAVYKVLHLLFKC